MKCCIAYTSTHHGNTKKVVDAIAKEFDVDVIDVTATHEKDLSEYDLIGFASGIYAAQFHQQVKNFAQVNLPQNKKIFYIMTSAMNKDLHNAPEEPDLYRNHKSKEDSGYGRDKEGAFLCGEECNSYEEEHIAEGEAVYSLIL